MNILFVEHKKNKRLGGMDKAASDLAKNLEKSGNSVSRIDHYKYLNQTPDIVHFHGIWSFFHFPINVIMSLKNVPTIISTHGLLDQRSFHYKYYKKKIYFELLEKKRLLKCSGILVTSEKEKNYVDSLIKKNKSYIIPIGIDDSIIPDYNKAREAIGWDNNEYIILFFGRIDPVKGVLELINSIKQLSLSYTPEFNVRLVIVGSGEKKYENRCREAAKKIEKPYKIEWYGPIWGLEKWKFFQGADLFCLPSFSENFGITIMEAAMVGTPILTTNNTPWEALSEKKYGLLVEPTIKAIKGGLYEFLSKSKLVKSRMEISIWARNKYGWSKLINEYEGFYKNIINNNNKEQRRR